jgi:hypothetical protein
VDWTNNWGFSDSIGMKGGAREIRLCSTCGWGGRDANVRVLPDDGSPVVHAESRSRVSKAESRASRKVRHGRLVTAPAPARLQSLRLLTESSR